MKFSDLEAQFPAIMDSGISVELVSAPGRGKSEFVKGFAKSRSWGFQTMFLATKSPADLMGYLAFTDKNGKKISEYAEPEWMRTDDGKHVTDYPRGILFLDEYGQGEADTKRASAELLLNRQLGPWKLPDGWSVVAASNRAKDRSGVTKSFDFAINRRLEIHITDDVESWKSWAMRHGVPAEFVAFADSNVHIVFNSDVPKEQGPWCTPRSLVMTARLLDKMRDPQGNLQVTPIATEIASGLIGAGAAGQLMATIQLGLEMPTLDDIVKDPSNVRVPEKPDARMLVAYNLAARITKDNSAAVVTYLERFPKEFAVTFGKSAIARDPKIVNYPAVTQWAMKNASLMTTIGGVK